jgi:hypothetical protein
MQLQSANIPHYVCPSDNASNNIHQVASNPILPVTKMKQPEVPPTGR